MHWDYAIYAVHAAFWGSFYITRARLRESDRATRPSAPAGVQTAPYSRALLGFHMLGFGVMYFGLGQAVLGGQVPLAFPLQRIIGAAVILAGAALACWALGYFRSWRFRAKLEAGHELATEGPFRFVRHPIYLGLNLLALGTALWVPSVLELVALALLTLGSDLRARAEEKLLLQAFGERYRAYKGKTKRFVPGLY